MTIKNISGFLAMFAITLLIAFTFTACEEEGENPIEPTPNITVSPVGTIFAGQTGNNAITVQWEASPSADSSWFTGYEVTITATSFDSVITRTKNQLNATVAGLDPALTYKFEVRALGTSGNTVVKSTVESINWALASHFTQTENQVEIRVYCKEATLGSGLQLSHIPNPPGALDGPRIRRVINGADWNLAVGSTSNLIIGSAVAVAAPSAANYNLTGTPAVNFEITAPMDFDSKALNNLLLDKDLSTMSYSNTYINLTTNSVAQAAKDGIVFFARGGNHYAKIVVLKNGTAGGGFLHPDSSDPYVRLLVSYQTRANVPFAKTSN